MRGRRELRAGMELNILCLNPYINLRSHSCLVCLDVCLCVRLYVSSSLHLVRFGQLLLCADKRIVNIMKVYSTSKATKCNLN